MVRLFSEIEILSKKAAREINEKFTVRAVYIFGSYADGTARDDSDIDLAIFADGVDSMGIEEKMDYIVNIQRNVSDDIELHLYPSSLLKDVRPTNFHGYITEHGKKIAA